MLPLIRKAPAEPEIGEISLIATVSYGSGEDTAIVRPGRHGIFCDVRVAFRQR